MFDKVPHKIWKCYLEYVGGVGGTLLVWIKDYLESRTMRIIVRERKSWLLVSSGASLGSVLGPVMFIVHIGDMVEGIASYITLFADDANLMRSVVEMDDSLALPSCIVRIVNWGWK